MTLSEQIIHDTDAVVKLMKVVNVMQAMNVIRVMPWCG